MAVILGTPVLHDDTQISLQINFFPLQSIRCEAELGTSFRICPIQ